MAELRRIGFDPDPARRRYAARWQLDGAVIETDMTAKEYAALSEKGAGEPSRKGVPAGAVWLHAGEFFCHDTPDGKLPLGGYYEPQEGRVFLGVGEVEPMGIAVAGGKIEDVMAEITTLSGKVRLENGQIEKVL